MSGRQHRYEAKIVWTGAEAGPAKDVRTFSREYRIEMPGKVAIRGSSDPAFRGDPALHNPEDLLVASLSACHMLWYLALCAAKGITVHAYEDTAEGVMVAEPRNGRFTEVTLHPSVDDRRRRRHGPRPCPARAGPRRMLRRQLGELSGAV